MNIVSVHELTSIHINVQRVELYKTLGDKIDSIQGPLDSLNPFKYAENSELQVCT